MTEKSALKARMVAAAALILLFGSGVVVGLALDQTAVASTPGELRVEERSEREGRRRRLIVDEVGLSAVQQAAVDSLVVFHRQRVSDLGAEFRPRYGAVFADLREEIKQVLTVDQRATYDVLLAEYDAERNARRHRNSRR